MSSDLHKEGTSRAGQRTVNGRSPMFSGDLHFLSNFDTTHFLMPALGGVEVPSGEHAFNALKAVDPTQRDWILSAPDPSEAKRRGGPRSGIDLRPGWDTGGRVRAMQMVLLAKFSVPRLHQMLMDTGDMVLAETNYWHDTFWGSECFAENSRCTSRCKDGGANMLGELLMALRSKTAFLGQAGVSQ